MIWHDRSGTLRRSHFARASLLPPSGPNGASYEARSIGDFVDELRRRLGP
jgi:hypothetical protein